MIEHREEFDSLEETEARVIADQCGREWLANHDKT